MGASGLFCRHGATELTGITNPASTGVRDEGCKELVEVWLQLREPVLRSSRSRKVCMTCHFFRHRVAADGIPELTCKLHRALIPQVSIWPAAARAGPMTSCDSRGGRHVLRFRPGRYSRWSQLLELIVGELLRGQPAPLLSLWFEVHEPAIGNQRVHRRARRRLRRCSRD